MNNSHQLAPSHCADITESVWSALRTEAEKLSANEPLLASYAIQ